ncbi:MAG: TIR domain-containing protein [Clostridia bacterium]|nr:TIR domain-containing protein [Clostridia bacterium]
MAIFKCKMCGGTIEFNEGATVGVCDSCGTKQTLPKLDDEKKANLYDRANHFRRNNEFDKAMGIYEQILNEDNTDAEAYWSLVLCRYGIEYVDDPATHTKVPTVNRTQFTSIFDDEDYKSAIKNADASQKSIYEEEAKAINEIQKGILAISQKEEPFDVFICYKETDNNGRRTPDSVLANDLYHQLTQEGFKVFFARITLEDKLGTAYEPYIFAALNSSKVMVVLGTKPEFFNAVWVKNEWSRYLALIKNGANKILIPAYKDMDPYDLPEEFSHLQAQDMGKLGFMQDLIRGIKKIAKADEPKAKEPVKATSEINANLQALLDRGFMALEDGEWQKADDFFEQALNFDAKLAEAYLGKLMAELQVKKREDLKNCKEPFENSNNYQKVIRFGSDSIKNELSDCIKYIKDRNENTRLTTVYNNGVSRMKSAKSEEQYKYAAETFNGIKGFKNAEQLAKECLEKAEVCRKDAIYEDAKSKMTGNDIINYKDAISIFSKISGYKDADEQIYACQQKIEEIKAKEEADRLERERQAEEKRIAEEKKKKLIIKTVKIATPIICAIIAFVIVLNTVIVPNVKYNAAIALIEKGDIINAYESLITLNGYKDSAEKANEIFGKYKIEKLKTAAVGDIVYFGAYEQDNNTLNGKEVIEWLVLAKEGNKALVISKYALDCRQYNTSYAAVTWETCSLRKWLNETFISAAFSSEEQDSIISSTVTADDNQLYNTSPGNNTTDKVFLLSITEVNKYFSSDSARQCGATAYAKAQGAYANASNGNCWWWLRSPGDYSNYATLVNIYGSVFYRGDDVSRGDDAVRPATWISFK